MFGVIVGAILIAINHGDAILRGELTSTRWTKMGLTVLVPYTVSTLSSVLALREMESNGEMNRETMQTRRDGP